MHERIKKIRTELSRIPCSLSLAMFATRCFALLAVWFFSPLLSAARQASSPASSQVGGSAPELWGAWSPSQVWKVNLRHSVSSTASTAGYNSFPVDMKPWNRIFDPSEYHVLWLRLWRRTAACVVHIIRIRIEHQPAFNYRAWTLTTHRASAQIDALHAILTKPVWPEM